MPAHHVNCFESICGASGKTRLSMLLDGPTKLDSTWRRLVRTASRAKSAFFTVVRICEVKAFLTCGILRLLNCASVRHGL